MLAAPRRAAAWLLDNPLLVMSARRRLRPNDALGWGVVTLVLTAWVVLGLYFSQTRRHLLEPAEAAKTAMLPLLIIQGVILMGLGTRSVAAGIAAEKQTGVLDYHRISPMSPARKIVGYLLGLPIREYFLFALTVPFLILTASIAHISPLALGRFYLVFFTSVLLYHAVGLAVGMVSKRSRDAGIIAPGLVFVLYVMVPQLSHIGFAALEFLTVRPTFYAILLEETLKVRGLSQRSAEAVANIARWKQVPLFEWWVRPTPFSLVLQGFLLLVALTVVYRKWRKQDAHSLSKRQAVGVFAGLWVLLVGSLWPCLRNPEVYEKVFRQLSGIGGAEEALAVLLYAYLAICGVAAIILIHVITPTAHSYRQGLRRAHKLNLPGVPWTSDASTGQPWTWAIVGLTALGAVLLFLVARGAGRFEEWASLRVLPLVITAVGFAAILIYAQAARELLGTRWAFLTGFIFWIVPSLLAIVIAAAWGHEVAAAYISVPCPPAWTFWSLAHLTPRDVQGALVRHLPALSWFGMGLSLALAAVLLPLLSRRLRALRAAEESARRA